ncbi:MAG TPA: cytochrome b/b6 domain-containing protein [Rhizomicrobium sp.]|nr:cytochrome b/b6 domain-containing protein [Rhizomicrobium sp.]
MTESSELVTQGNAGTDGAADRIRKAIGLTPRKASYVFYRHTIPVRALHWINALCMLVMLMSGLQIFNAHPALYWGNGADFAHPVVSLSAVGTQQDFHGITQIAGWTLNTDGVLGASYHDGVKEVRGFPDWVTLPADSPNLALGRLWHFAFAWLLVANGAAYFAYAFASGHFSAELLPKARDFANLPHEIANHARLRFPKGEEARHYNGIQRMAYFIVVFVLGPLIVLTGLTMSPTMDSAFPFLPWIFDGRQSARTIHFLCAFSFLAFFIVHMIMVVLSGTWNNLRSMITGRYAIETEAKNG